MLELMRPRVEFQQLAAFLAATNEDSFVIGTRDGCYIPQRSTRQAYRVTSTSVPNAWPVTHGPDLARAIVPGFEHVVLSVRGPTAAALGRRTAPTGEHGMEMGPISRHLRQRSRVGFGIAHGKAQAASVRRPARPQRNARCSCELPGLAPVASGNVDITTVPPQRKLPFARRETRRR